MLQATTIKLTHQTLDTLRDAIEKCPPELWKRKADYLVPCKLAFHALQALEYYVSPDPDAYQWGQYGFDWEGGPLEQMWDQPETLAYLARLEEQTRTFIKEQDLLAADSHPQFFQSRLDRMLYAMRHTTLHTGELNAILSQAGVPWGDWL